MNQLDHLLVQTELLLKLHMYLQRSPCFGISAVDELLSKMCIVAHLQVLILTSSPLAVPLQAAGNVEGNERAARQGVRTAGRDSPRAGDHQREAGAGEQGLAAENRQVTVSHKQPLQ